MMQGAPLGSGDLVSSGSIPNEQKVKAYRMPSVQIVPYVALLVSRLGLGHALIPMQVIPGKCVSQTRRTWMNMSLKIYV